MIRDRHGTRAVVLVLFSMGSSMPLLGQTNGETSAAIEEIVVTARLRSETLQEVPVTVNAFTAEEIEDAGIQRPNDYLSLVPNVTLVEAQNAGTTFLTIRGITQVRNNEPPVAVAIDGMLQTSPNQFNQALLDLQQIEVLKGPQGALYGRNAIGGAINITTKQPADELQGRVQVGAGNGDHLQAQVSLSGPVAEDRLYYRLNGTWLDRGGYIENVFRGDQVDYIEERSLQLRLDWLINDAWGADFRAYYSNTRGGALNYNWQAFDYELDAFTFRAADANDAAGVIYEMNNRGENDRDIVEVALKLDYQADWGTFTSITANNQLEEWYGSDQAPYSESLTLYPFGPGIPFDGVAQQYWDVDAFSQEIRFSSPGDRALRWLVGAYYVQTNRFISTPVVDDTGVGIVRIEREPTGSGQPTTFSFLADDNDNSAYALFGQLNYDVSEQFEASLALRYDEDRRAQIVSPHNTTGSQGARREATFDKLQPKLTLRYLPTPRVNLFASYSEGFRSGQFNQLGTSAAAQSAGIDGVFDVVGQEETEAVEVGLKAQILGGRGKFDASLFNTRVKGQQYFLFFAPTSAQVLAGIDEVRLSGGEIEFSAFLFDRLDVYAGYGITNSEIEAYSVDPGLVGNDAPYVPDHTINLGFQYRQPLTDGVGLLLRTDFERRGRQFWDPDNSSARNDVDLVNVRFGLEGERWQIIAWSKNLADELYLAEFVSGGFVHLAPPRSYGVDFTYTF